MFNSPPKYRPRWSTVFALVGYTALLRWHNYVLPGLDAENPSLFWNFSPLYALAIFGGATFRSRELPLVWPLAIMFATDIGIGAFSGNWDWAFYGGTQVCTYACFAAFALIGTFSRRRPNPLTTVGGAYAGSLFFFLVTNGAVWLFGTAPKTLAGLLHVYELGIPFFTNVVVSTLVFGAILMSPLGCVPNREAQAEPEAVPVGERG